jgi:hypothetical protein
MKPLKSWKSAPWKKDALALVPILTEWQETIESMTRVTDILSDVFGTGFDGSCSIALDAAICHAHNLAEIACGDNDSHWLTYYAYECDFGEKGMGVSLWKGDKEKPVKTLFDLAVILTAPKP